MTAPDFRRSSPFRCWRHMRMHRRRAEHAQLKRLLGQDESPPPSDFGLTDAALRAEGNRLVLEYGWSVPEVLEVLDIDPAGAR